MIVPEGRRVPRKGERVLTGASVPGRLEAVHHPGGPRMESRIRIAVGLAAALLALGARAGGKDPYGTLSMDQVEKMLGLPNVVVIDANHDDVYKKNHLPGAVFMQGPLAKLLPADKGRTLVFYCASPS
jgi:hypothetical protein